MPGNAVGAVPAAVANDEDLLDLAPAVLPAALVAGNAVDPFAAHNVPALVVAVPGGAAPAVEDPFGVLNAPPPVVDPNAPAPGVADDEVIAGFNEEGVPVDAVRGAAATLRIQKAWRNHRELRELNEFKKTPIFARVVAEILKKHVDDKKAAGVHITESGSQYKIELGARAGLGIGGVASAPVAHKEIATLTMNSDGSARITHPSGLSSVDKSRAIEEALDIWSIKNPKNHLEITSLDPTALKETQEALIAFLKKNPSQNISVNTVVSTATPNFLTDLTYAANVAGIDVAKRLNPPVPAGAAPVAAAAPIPAGGAPARRPAPAAAAGPFAAAHVPGVAAPGVAAPGG